MKKSFILFNQRLFQIVFFTFIVFIVSSCSSGTPKQQPNDAETEQSSAVTTDEGASITEEAQSATENETPVDQPEDISPIEKFSPNQTEEKPKTVTKKPKEENPVEGAALSSQAGNNTTTSNTPKYTDVSNNKSWDSKDPNETSNATEKTDVKESTLVDKYKMTLDASKEMKIKESYNLTVWVGLEKSKEAPKVNSDNMVRDSIITEDNLGGLYFKASFDTSFFIFKPIGPTEYHLVAPNGTVAKFTVIPKETGTRKIEATVGFYKDKEGKEEVHVKSPIENSLSVEVKINWFSGLVVSFQKNWEIFTSSLIVLLFGTLLFVIRRFIKKKTGYDPEEDSPINKIKDTFKKKE